MIRLLAALALAAMLVGPACKDQGPRTEPPAQPTPAAQPKAEPRAEPKAQPAAAATVEPEPDYADEARKQITEENMDEELKKLEAEMAAEAE